MHRKLMNVNHPLLFSKKWVRGVWLHLHYTVVCGPMPIAPFVIAIFNPHWGETRSM